MSTALRHADHDALHARLGASLAAALNERAATLPHDITERLRFARERALSRAQAQAATSGPRWRFGLALATGTPGGASSGGTPWWQRAAALLPLLMLVLGLGLIDNWSTREQVLAAAEIDALLLADDLPPAAYTDPGFAEFLRSPPAP